MSTSGLTPEQRSMRARMGAYATLAKHGRHKTTEAARAANPSSDAYWLAQISSDLPEAERIVRANDLKRSHFARLALASSRARARKAAES